MPYTVRARGVTKTYGDRLVLDDVDLDVPTGSVVAMLGPNGAGKTTMVRVLATLTQPDAGEVTVAGHDVRTDAPGVRRAISLTGQSVAVDDVLSGRENLEMVGELLHLPRRRSRARAGELLDAFDLAGHGDRRAGTYSGGMRRRLDLAVSMIARPTLLFLDEPTTGLDPVSREHVWTSVRELVADGVTILLTTQYLEEADRLADRVVMLDAGRVVAEGPPEELKAELGGEVVRLEFAGEESFLRAVGCLGVGGAAALPHTIDVQTDGSAVDVLRTLQRLDAAGAPAHRVSTLRPSLDDVFRSLTQHGPRPVSRKVSA